MRRELILFFALIALSIACSFTASPAPASTPIVTDAALYTATQNITTPRPTVTPVPSQTEAATEKAIPSETASPLPSLTPLPTVERLKAKVTADLLSCRYGPGAEYLYLYALKKTANIELIGRTDANNWVWVDGKNKCWVNTDFLEIQGDPLRLPIVYPGLAKLPVSPYYPGPRWANSTRKGDSVEVNWEAVPISPGKYEDENMHQYLVEVWRCENGQIRFDTLGTNLPHITVENDQAGCSDPSHGRVFVQEKHGYGGPVEIPWPQHP